MFFDLWSIVQWYLRPIIKWFLRQTTRLCELQRICYGEKVGAARTCGVEGSLVLSRTHEIKEILSHWDDAATQHRFIPQNFIELIDPALATIIKVKNINPKSHRPFLSSFRRCVQQIWMYKQLLQEVEDLRTTAFDSSDDAHEERLLSLWAKLVPDQLLESRVTKQWQFIGFQGDDPKTDFRGMGLLGLENLLFFTTEYPLASRHVLSHSHHPKYGYTYAIVGINLTSLAYTLLRDGSAKTYMFNSKNLPDLSLFHRFYCFLFYEFDKLWIDSKPQNIMEFSTIFKKFEVAVRLDLSDPASVFRINLEVDTI